MSLRHIKASQKKILYRVITVILITAFIFLYYLGKDLKLPFVAIVLAIYVLMLPKKILNPKNIVFVFYMMWYGIAPLFASRYHDMSLYQDEVNGAFLMCFITYSLGMLTLDIVVDNVEEKINKQTIKTFNILSQDIQGKFIVALALAIGFAVYVHRTGGLMRWLTDSYGAFFSRRGSGMYFLLFTLSLTVFIFIEGQRHVPKLGKDLTIIRRICFIAFLLLMSIFVGSKGITLTLFLMLYCDIFLFGNLISIQTITLGIVGVTIYLVNMYIRMGGWKAALGYSLNYFNTFENLCTLLKAHEPGWLKTVFMPFLWPFIKLGLISDEYFYDMSIWLTVENFPNSWYIEQSTEQWPIEADLYLSFHYYFGLPLIIFYFVVIGFLYKKALTTGNVWKLIYVNEAVAIMSHLRGGVFIYWYWYLIPLYAWLVMRYDKTAKLQLCFGNSGGSNKKRISISSNRGS